jgi:hypothetical protein
MSITQHLFDCVLFRAQNGNLEVPVYFLKAKLKRDKWI